jgi:hypothetical protein
LVCSGAFMGAGSTTIAVATGAAPSHRDRGSMRDPCPRERLPKSRNGNAPGQLLERRQNSTPPPAHAACETRPRCRGNSTRRQGNSTVTPWELDRATAPRTEGQAMRLHRGKTREAKRKRSAPINQHREGGRPSCLPFIR